MTSATAVPAPVVARAAAAVTALRARIAAQHAAGAPGLQTCTLASDLFDAVIRDVWDSAVAPLPAAVRDGVALVALGGCGRREMAPFSDIDVMVLHDGADRGAVTAVAARLLQDLFDAGLQVGQSVRTVDEACGLATGDATITSALLDARPLAGPTASVARLGRRLRTAIRRAPGRVAAALVAARREEADRFGQTVALLEPNVKRSPGGLRDVQLAHWLGIVLHGAESFADLALLGRLSRDDADALRDAAEFLLRVRTDLHLAAGRAADDLTRGEQARIARERGIESTAGLLGVERFMRDYFGHVRRVERIAGRLAAGIGRPGPVRRLAARALGHRVEGLFRVGPRSVGAQPGCAGRIAAGLDSVLRLVELAQLYGLPIDLETWDAVRAAAPALPRVADPPARAAFLRLFAAPDRLGESLRRLHDAGLLEVLIPEFGHARDLLQFNNFHKYTVDEHCILAVERATALATAAGWAGAAWRQLTRRRPLLLALLLHDLGKGLPGDHSEVGALIARDVTARLELPADEAEIVEFLVARHLAMSHLAFRRDTGDDSLVRGFVRDVGSPEVLRMLALLTAADTAAVGPGTWTKWKEEVLGDLYFRALAFLDDEQPTPAASDARRALAGLLADRAADDPIVQLAGRLPDSILRHTDPRTILEELGRLARLPLDGIFAVARWRPETATVAVTVGTRESVAPGVFQRIAGALSAQRLEILGADIHTFDDGLVIDHFAVHDPDYDGEPPAERLAEIGDAVRAGLRGGDAPVFARRWNPFAPQVQPAVLAPPRVRVDAESSARTTIVEVFAHDAPGLLHALARAIFTAGLSVRAAKIGTYLDQVVDTFHVVEPDGRKPTDPARLAALRVALERAAASPAPRG